MCPRKGELVAYVYANVRLVVYPQSSRQATGWKRWGSHVRLRELMEKCRQVSLWTEETAKTYGYVVNVICSDFGYDPDLQEMTVDWFVGYRQRSLERLSPVTFNSRRRHLSAMAKYAIDQGWLTKNVFRIVKPAPVPYKRPKSVPKDVLLDYIATLERAYRIDRHGMAVEKFPPQWFWLACLQTLYYTGVRLRQLVGLLWSDIDFEAKSIRLRAETSKTRREWEIPIAEPLLPILLDLRKRTLAIRQAQLADHQVFCLPLFGRRFQSKVMTKEHVARFFVRFMNELPPDACRISAHRLRHTTATQLLKVKGNNLKAVQQLLGHTSVHTTLQYVHPDLDDMRAAVEAL